MALTTDQLEAFAAVLRARYIAHEITASDFASLMEDIKLSERRLARAGR